MCTQSFRIFHCDRCQKQVLICRRCDHGNIYCADGCAAERRRQSLRRAGARYQRRPRGAKKHAKRQDDYRRRARERQKVTHQVSTLVPSEATPPQPVVTSLDVVTDGQKETHHDVVDKQTVGACHRRSMDSPAREDRSRPVTGKAGAKPPVAKTPVVKTRVRCAMCGRRGSDWLRIRYVRRRAAPSSAIRRRRPRPPKGPKGSVGTA